MSKSNNKPATANKIIELPPRCTFNGSRDGLVKRTETIVVFPYWSLAFIPLGLLPFVLAFAVLRKEQQVSYWLSPAGRKRVALLRVCTLGCILLMFASIYWALNYTTSFLYLTIGSVFIAALLYRAKYYPFKYRLDGNKEFVIYGLPVGFDTSADTPVATELAGAAESPQPGGRR
jgi:hypothetical protein